MAPEASDPHDPHVEIIIHVPKGVEPPSEDDVWTFYVKTGVTEATVPTLSTSGFVATKPRVYEFDYKT